MISELVGRSKLRRTSPSNNRFAPDSGWPLAPVGVGVGAGVELRDEVRDRELPAPVTTIPVTAPIVWASSSQLAFSQ